MRFTPWATRLALTLGLSVTALLTACGGGGNGNKAQIRLLNATQSLTALDLVNNNNTLNSKVAYATTGSYTSIDTGNTASNVLDSSVGTSVAATAPTLNSGSNYTLIAYGWSGAVRTSLLQENQTAPASGKASLLVLNLAPDAGALDVYVLGTTDDPSTAPPLTSNLLGGSGSGFNQQNSGTFRVVVTGYGNRSDLRLDIPAVTLGSASTNTLILTATSGGVLVNGMQLVQQGAVTNYPNSLARVRVVNAMGGSAQASVTLNGSTVLPTSLPPNITSYASVPVGAPTLGVTVNGTPLTVSPYTVSAGGDYTALVWGSPSAPQLSWVVDDNRLPTGSGNVKMRLVNGLSDTTALPSLNVDYTARAINVQSGQASTAATFLPNSSGSLVTVNSSLSPIPLYNPSATTSTSGLTPLTANAVYSVFVMGDLTTVSGGKTAVGLLVRDH